MEKKQTADWSDGAEAIQSCCKHQRWLQWRQENVSPLVDSRDIRLHTPFHVLLNFSVWNFSYVEQPSSCDTFKLEQRVTPANVPSPEEQDCASSENDN